MDIKAGVSGAGREATEETHFVSAVDNVNAYKIEGHRHRAELEQELPGVRFSFLAHLLPIDQGMIASCYATPGEPLTKDEARELFESAYADEPFVDVVEGSPRTREVRNTNRAQVHVTVVDGRVLALLAIDNLWKGAAGQAVQDLNLMLGLPETEGLDDRRSSARAGSRRRRTPREAADTGLPAGFRAAGVAAGIKPEGLDVGVLVSDESGPRSPPLASPRTRAWGRP